MTTHFAAKTVASAPRPRPFTVPRVTGPAFWECVADVVSELRSARPDVQLIDVAYWSRASQGALSRFENHENQPRDLDRLVVCYAKVLDTEPMAIMEEALRRWEAAGGAALPATPFPSGPLLPSGGEIEKRAQAAGRRKTARGRRPSGQEGRRRDAE